MYSSFLQDISAAADSVYQFLLKIVVDLFAQVSYVNIHGVGASCIVKVPQIIFDHGPGKDLAFVAEQIFEQSKLLGGKSDVPAAS